MEPDVSVVLCTYNRADMLGPALESLVRQETHGQFIFEVVVVDDGSTDGTQVILQRIAKDTQVLIRCLQEEGRGIAAARNTGIASAAGEWIAFFDDDQVAEPDWLSELFALALKTHSQCVGGARFLLLAAQELFDESWKDGGSDIELTARLRRAGVEAWFMPTAIVHHHVPAYRLKESYLFWSSLRIGNNFAHRDFKEWGLVKSTITCLARIGQAALVNFPLLLLAYILGNKADVIGRKCLLLRAWGYLRESLYLVSPWVLSQEMYFSRLNFRSERSAFARSSKSTELRNPSE